MRELEDFYPETVTEMMLWQEIQRLKSKMRYSPQPDVKAFEIGTSPTKIVTPTVMLHLGAHLEGNIQPDGSLRVLMQIAEGENKFHVAYYVTSRELSVQSSLDLAEHLHKRFIQILLKVLRDALMPEDKEDD